jgi:hypothetical protein
MLTGIFFWSISFPKTRAKESQIEVYKTAKKRNWKKEKTKDKRKEMKEMKRYVT